MYNSLRGQHPSLAILATSPRHNMKMIKIMYIHISTKLILYIFEMPRQSESFLEPMNTS